MKPVAIFRHAPTEGPGYFATVLERHQVPWRLIKVDAGEAVPADPRAFSGLVFMGGPMSVNDDLPWIAAVLRLIRSGVDADVPVLGHCLGGQLMSAALGGTVSRNPVKEIGWGEVVVADTPQAQQWLGHSQVTDRLLKHALRNVMIPVVTIAGLSFGELVAFSIVTETIFQWPGMGNLLLTSIFETDQPVIVTYIMLAAVIILTINILVDLMYAFLNPKIRYE